MVNAGAPSSPIVWADLGPLEGTKYLAQRGSAGSASLIRVQSPFRGGSQVGTDRLRARTCRPRGARGFSLGHAPTASALGQLLSSFRAHAGSSIADRTGSPEPALSLPKGSPIAWANLGPDAPAPYSIPVIDMVNGQGSGSGPLLLLRCQVHVLLLIGIIA